MARKKGEGQLPYQDQEDQEDAPTPRHRQPKRTKVERVTAMLRALPAEDLKSLPTLVAAEIERRVSALRA